MSIDYLKLEEALTDALEKYVSNLLALEPASRIYALGLYTHDEFSYVMPTANVCSREEDTSATLPTLAEKWSPPDWKYHGAFPETFAQVEGLMLAGWNAEYTKYTVDVSHLYALLLRVLSSLRERRFADSSTTLGVFMGGMGHPLVLRSIGALNPPHLAQNPPLDSRAL